MSLNIQASFNQVIQGFQLEFKKEEKLAYCTLLAGNILAGAVVGTLLTASAWTFTLVAGGAALASIAIIYHRKRVADSAEKGFQTAMEMEGPAKFEQLEGLANQGHVDSQIELAEMYLIRHEEEHQKAFDLFLNLADQGNRFALIRVAEMYRDGKGVPQNPQKAFEYFLKVADQGDVYYQVYVACEYLDKKDEVKAFNYFLKAANQGDKDAQVQVAVMFLIGKGITKDLPQAFNYFLKAADQGDVDSRNQVAHMYSIGMGVEKSDSLAFKYKAK